MGEEHCDSVLWLRKLPRLSSLGVGACHGTRQGIRRKLGPRASGALRMQHGRMDMGIWTWCWRHGTASQHLLQVKASTTVPMPQVETHPMYAHGGLHWLPRACRDTGEAIEVLALPLAEAQAFMDDTALPKSAGLLYGLLWLRCRESGAAAGAPLPSAAQLAS